MIEEINSEIPEEIQEKEVKNKISYMELDYYDEYFDFHLKSNQTFLVEQTTYTKKIKCGRNTIIFNQDGMSDFTVLALINKVRNDAKRWFEKNQIPTINEQDIFWSRLTERPPNTVITKVDINSAYWQAALKRGIIKDSTDRYLFDKYKITKEQKGARLKALGSLATRKIVTEYTNGEQYNNYTVVQTSRPLYMFICQSVDEVMNEVCVNTEGAFFYYWDCIFTGSETTQEVLHFIKDKGYAAKTEDAEQTIETIGNNRYIVTTESEKIFLDKIKNNPNHKKEDSRKEYPVKPNDYFFLTNESKLFKR